ncbi:PucR C-terminal helix-turn-helix domain-containing protein [Raineyella antarctica]|uniref:PucR C-terminal helix-turn-helix domain-containing protein n=1 Tax=Raineyella antarctica TaxID=1577474 RepID=A0A1G6IAN8_9ACTN|nr:helix-turn-helix domain-containing protein [Raineyella antarctica]SDC03602.1 PucR C-terminal helix-turn-helix domain-containing protein [Raineyella antarctica]
MAPSADLHDTLQDLSELLGRRLVLTDERLRVVGYSIHETEADRVRLSTVLAHSDAWQVPPAGTEQVRDLPGHGTIRLLPLRDNRQQVGFLLVPCAPDEADLPEAAREILAQHTPTLGMLLSLRSLYAERDHHRMSGLLRDLVGDTEAARRTAAESFLREGMLGASRNYSAVALGCDAELGALPDPDATVELAVESVIEFVARTSTASLVGAVLEDGVGVLVFPRAVVAERLERLLDRTELATIRAGIGPLVGDLDRVADSFRRARDALRVNTATRSPVHVSVWDSLGIDRVLVRLPLAALGPDDLPVQVRRLLAAGLGEELLGTVEAYLDCGGDVAATTGALHIHRSTLYYRLGRIGALAGVDIADPVLRQELTIGMRIARLAGIV